MKNIFKSNLFWTGFIIFLILSAVVCYLPTLFIKNSADFDFTDTGQIGDTIGGTMGPFVAMIAALLTYFAFVMQFEANQQQREQFKNQAEDQYKDNISTAFLEMVKFHRENVALMTYTSYTNKEKYDKGLPTVSKGHKVFNIIFYQFKDLYDELKPVFSQNKVVDIYEDNYLIHLKQNKTLNRQIKPIDLELLAKLDVLFLIIFFGVSKDGYNTILKFIDGKYKKSFYEPLLLCASIKPKNESIYWRKWHWFKINLSNKNIKAKIIEDLLNLKNAENIENDGDIKLGDLEVDYYDKYYFEAKYDKYYGGHQFRLGHYYRNFFQAVNLIHSETRINYIEKHRNIKLLRGQLSTFEQYVLFLNSISQLGRSWDIGDKKMQSNAKEIKDQLITRYELIRNIPSDTITDEIQISNFYPFIDYEGFDVEGLDINTKRVELELIYKQTDTQKTG